MATPKTGKPVGRPTTYSEEMCQNIVHGLISGLSLIKICEQEGFPSRSTVMSWWEKYPDFEAKCARARVMQADWCDDQILDLIESVTEDTVQSARVKLSALQWRASKLNPRKYGDKVVQEQTGPDGGPIRTVTEIKTVKDAADAYNAAINKGK